MLSCLSLLLAVTMSVQDATPAPPKPRARRRAPIVTIAPELIGPMTIGPMSISPGVITPMALAADLSSLSSLASLASLQSLAPMALTLAQPGVAIAMSEVPLVMATPLPTIAARDFDAHDAHDAYDAYDAYDAEDELDQRDFPRAQQGDVADSVYRAARQALNDNQYQRAAELFGSIRDKYPRSTYVPNTYYWQAFALYREGSADALRAAREALQTQKRRYPNATTRRDAEALLRRVQGALARQGDADAAEAAVADADLVVPPTPVAAAQPPQAPQPAARPKPGRASRSAACNDDDEDDIRIAALNAVLQMDAERAVPLLKTVLARRDEGSACLRRKAVFLVSQKRSDETSRILLDAVRNDPDKEVREQAVFWLSQVPGDETVAALDSILQDPRSDPEIQEKAIFALSQHRSPRAAAILCTYSGRRDRPAELREKSIFWLGQRRSAENQQCLRDLYKNLDTDDLKEKVIFSLSQMGGADNYRWLMDIALNARENIELRKKALFWAGQGRNVDVADLVRLYDSMADREMKEQLIFVYSQRREDAALEKLFQIGRSDPDRELRKKAIFWVGQSRSPKAAQYLQELINQ